jgi:outer membrane immunogenic protein
MRRIFSVITAAIALSFVALGANMQSAAAAPATYNWSGLYLGLNAGGNWGTVNPSTGIAQAGTYLGACGGVPDPCANIAAAGGQSFNTSGFTGGVLGGYNWQSGNFLAGIEVDFQYFRSAGSRTVSSPLVGGITFNLTTSLSTDWLFTARPRIGLVTNNWLLYGTGGLALAQLKGTWDYSDNNNAPCTCESASASVTKAGWTIGGGVEVALPGNWFIGGEYLYVQFGSISVTSANLAVPGVAGFTDVFAHSVDLNTNIVRARLSKKFP